MCAALLWSEAHWLWPRLSAAPQEESIKMMAADCRVPEQLRRQPALAALQAAQEAALQVQEASSGGGGGCGGAGGSGGGGGSDEEDTPQPLPGASQKPIDDVPSLEDLSAQVGRNVAHFAGEQSAKMVRAEAKFDAENRRPQVQVPLRCAALPPFSLCC